jgi:hypothetical protein
MSKETGGSAFPSILEYVGFKEGYRAADGMTLRDYFAAKAMQANVMAMSDLSVEADNPTPMTWHNEVSRLAYMTADAMLEARSKS